MQVNFLLPTRAAEANSGTALANRPPPSSSLAFPLPLR